MRAAISATLTGASTA